MVMFSVGPELPYSEKCRNLNFSVPWSSTLRGEAREFMLLVQMSA